MPLIQKTIPPIDCLDPRTQRCCVIGVTGLLGGSIAGRLVAEGFPVRGVRRWSSKARVSLAQEIELVVADVLDVQALRSAMGGCSYVFYAVAPDEGLSTAEILIQSVQGIRNTLEVAHEVGVEKIVLTSSASTMARVAPGVLASEGDVYLPGSSADPFVEAKYAVERECYRSIADGMSLVILNPTLCVGPEIDLSNYCAYGPSPKAPLNTVGLRAVVDAHVRALVHGRSGERYLIAGENQTVEDVFGKRGLKRSALQRVAKRLVGSEGRARDAALVEAGQWVDGTKAREELFRSGAV